ncbi:unnamed protein product, partial [Brenthis ino]
MKLLIIFALVTFAAARPDDDYSRYDGFDVDELIGNLRLLKNYAHCFLEKGKCTPEGNDFKKWIPDAVQTKCGKCSEKQKTLIAKVMNSITEKLPEEWTELNKLHNPEGKHDAPLKEFLDKYGH